MLIPGASFRSLPYTSLPRAGHHHPRHRHHASFLRRKSGVTVNSCQPAQPACLPAAAAGQPAWRPGSGQACWLLVSLATVRQDDGSQPHAVTITTSRRTHDRPTGHRPTAPSRAESGSDARREEAVEKEKCTAAEATVVGLTVLEGERGVKVRDQSAAA